MLSGSYASRFGVCSVVCEGWDVSPLEAGSPLYYTVQAACVGKCQLHRLRRAHPVCSKKGWFQHGPPDSSWSPASVLFSSFCGPEVLTRAYGFAQTVCADSVTGDARLLAFWALEVSAAGQSHRRYRLRDWLPNKIPGHVCSGSDLSTFGNIPNV